MAWYSQICAQRNLYRALLHASTIKPLILNVNSFLTLDWLLITSTSSWWVQYRLLSWIMTNYYRSPYELLVTVAYKLQWQWHIQETATKNLGLLLIVDTVNAQEGEMVWFIYASWHVVEKVVAEFRDRKLFFSIIVSKNSGHFPENRFLDFIIISTYTRYRST